MIYLDTFLYYTLFASAVLFYGIGINRVKEIGISNFYSITFYIKAALNILGTSMLTWLITSNILIPLKLVELFPIICFLIFAVLSSFLEALIRLTTGKSTAEFVVSFLIVLLSIFESTSLINSIVICFSCFAAIIVLLPLCYAFKFRFSVYGAFAIEKYYTLFLFFLAILIIILTTFDISWISEGVIQ